MSLNIIGANPTHLRVLETKEPFLNISEFFCDTIQGENFVGYPAAFLRLQNCTMDCHWCDTSEVWRYGNPYTFDEIFDLMDQADLPRKLQEGQHLVLTGGSPLKQQDSLFQFIFTFFNRYDFKPFIEIENECTIMPNIALVGSIDLWNNSPKLINSGNPTPLRYQRGILKYLSKLYNSWFKFVILDKYDWMEIERDFIKPGLIKKSQVVLMPEGATREKLEANREKVIQIAIENNVRYTTREHVVLWDKATGV